MVLPLALVIVTGTCGAFDRGLITIDADYRVVVSAHLIENSGHPYNLGLYHGKQMRLPAIAAHTPGKENVAWHRERVFKE